MANLPLTPVVNVTYSISAIGVARNGFDLGLIIGPSDVIDPSDRVVVYGSLTEMIDDGFTTESPEYLAAVKYFGATSSPTQVAIGVWPSGETALQAVTACRAANTEWYICYLIGPADQDVKDVAAYIEALSHYSFFMFDNDDSAVLNGSPDNLFEQLADLNYTRTLGLYSGTTYAAAAVMGYAMGATRDTNNSAYTLMFKTLPGVLRDDITTQQVNNIEENRGNTYVTRSGSFTWLEQGKTFGDRWFDEVIFLDKLANQVQLNVANLFYTTTKVPQTEDGVSQIKAVISSACGASVNIGFIAPGVWTGANLLTLQTGQTLPTGFLIMSESIDSQDPQDRSNRIAPPIYIAVKTAGAIQSVVVQINVNR